jgi:hypothetical protein
MNEGANAETLTLFSEYTIFLVDLRAPMDVGMLGKAGGPKEQKPLGQHFPPLAMGSEQQFLESILLYHPGSHCFLLF